MRRGRLLLSGVILAAGIAQALAQQANPPASDPSPWHVSKVSKLDRARASQPVAEANSEKYLHIQLDFNVPPGERKMHKFRVVDQRGTEVGELWGLSAPI